MSSLLLSASPWKNEDSETNTTNKKRTPTLRRPANAQLQHPQIQNDFSHGSASSTYTNTNVSKENSAASVDKIYKDFEANVDDVKAANIDRQSRIDELLNKITAADNNEKMGNFKPLEHPSVQVKGDFENAELPKYNPKLPSFAAATIQMRQGDAEYSNYAQSYEPPTTNHQYVSRDANVNPGTGVAVVDKKLLEKINYLIHMMEQQKNEKTSNITEEFILYTFLGIFIIYVIDSFARVGKYTR